MRIVMDIKINEFFSKISESFDFLCKRLDKIEK